MKPSSKSKPFPRMAYFYQILSNGLHNGALYALLAYGYMMIHQVVPRPNLAHGALFAFAGQVLVLGINFAFNGLVFTLVASLAFGLGMAALLAGIATLVLTVSIMPRFATRSPNMMIVCTLALAIVLMEAQRIGADGRDFWLPPFTSGAVQLGLGATITVQQAGNMAVIALVLLLTDVVLTFTSAGRALRCVSEDAAMAALCGIDPQRVIARTVAAGCALACIGGVLAVLHFGNMSFGSGLSYGLKILFIASAGGFSNPRNAAFAAFCFGEAEALWDGYFPVLWREVVFLTGLSLLLMLQGQQRKI